MDVGSKRKEGLRDSERATVGVDVMQTETIVCQVDP